MNPDMSAKKAEDLKAMSVLLKSEFNHLRNELKVGSFISRNLNLAYCCNKTSRNLHFSEVGEGGCGQCFLVTPTENALESLARSGKFLAKKLHQSESTDQNEIVKEIARILLITHLGHYGIVESHTIERNINDNEVEEGRPLILTEFDSSQNMTIYATMRYIEGRPLSEAIDNKELTHYDKLRIAVRIADTMNFLHSYKLAHCDLSCNNVMVTQGTNDPILIDFGNMRTGGDFSILDTSSYHAMIFRMYRHCKADEIPAVVKPIFDKWDDEDHRKMSFKDITDKYFEKLSAYHAFASVADGATGFSNTVPVKRVGAGIVMVSFEAIGKSRSFTEYMEQVGVSLAEQDKKIKDYLETK